jgi:hypothetical protein
MFTYITIPFRASHLEAHKHGICNRVQQPKQKNQKPDRHFTLFLGERLWLCRSRDMDCFHPSPPLDFFQIENEYNANKSAAAVVAADMLVGRVPQTVFRPGTFRSIVSPIFYPTIQTCP